MPVQRGCIPWRCSRDDNVTKTYQRGHDTRCRCFAGSRCRSSGARWWRVDGPVGLGEDDSLVYPGLPAHSDRRPTCDRWTEDRRTTPRNGSGRFVACSIGFVFQQFNLFPSLSARENVEYALNLKRLAQGGEERREADRVLEAVGLADRKDFLPRDLWGGQRRRLAMAQGRRRSRRRSSLPTSRREILIPRAVRYVLAHVPRPVAIRRDGPC